MPFTPLLLVTLALFSNAPAQEAPWLIGLPELHRLDLMPAFKRSIKIGAVTSYDRTGGNDDGFSGKYSFIRKEGDALVLADIKGPGCIYRIHTPTPTDDPLEIYFDGEASPRVSLPFRQLFTGKVSPFVKPLVDYAGGGYYCYVPLPFKKSCKVMLRGKSLQFYDLNYAIYPEDAPVQTFDPKAIKADDLERAKAVFDLDALRSPLEFNMPAGAKPIRHAFDTSLPAGKGVTVFQSNKGGRIAAIKIGPADAFVSKARDILLKVTWDNSKQPAILCPLGDFFGYGWGKPAMGSRLLGTRDNTNYCYMPMPYDKSAKIELVSLRNQAAAVKGEVIYTGAPRKPNEGKFYAVWNRENPTTPGKPFTFLDTKGRGHLVGLALQSQGTVSGTTEFFEGDDQTTVDGELVVHGTGSEDFFNGGWYDVPERWDATFARALSGCMAYQKYLGRTGAYRFFIGDAYPYRNSILQTIEHGPVGNQFASDYSSMAYFYGENPPTTEQTVPTLAQRQVVDLESITFSAGWAVPINSFAFNAATLSRKDVPTENGNARVLSMRANAGDFFGPPFIALMLDLPAVGKYKLYVDVVKGPEQGKLQLFRDESPVGEPQDLYSEKPQRGNRFYLGEMLAMEGPNRVMFKIVGKNEQAKAFGLDLVNVICVKVKP